MFSIFKRIRTLEEEVRRLKNENNFIQDNYNYRIIQLKNRVCDLEKKYKLKKKGKKKDDKNIK